MESRLESATLEDLKCTGDSIGRYSLLRLVLESCRKVLEVGTSKFFCFFFTYKREHITAHLKQVPMSVVLLEIAEQKLFTHVLYCKFIYFGKQIKFK